MYRYALKCYEYRSWINNVYAPKSGIKEIDNFKKD